MAKPIKNPRPILLTAGLSLVVIASAILLTWLYLKNANKIRPTVAYSSFAPVVVRGPEYSIAATFALQTSPGDKSWVDKHQTQLTEVFKDALNGVDPAILRAPNGLLAVQKSMKEIGNTALKTEKIQQILFTDFIMQSN